MLRFILTPRWIGLLVVVMVLGFTCVKLSEWQFHRYQERHDSNTVVRTNLAAAPVPIGSLLSTKVDPSSAQEWRTVTTTGHYDATRQIALLYRTRGGHPGVDVVTPFVTTDGTAVLVDRGWIQTAGNGNITPKLPAPASGTVTLSGWIRVDSDGNSSEVTLSQGSVRAISAVAIRSTLPYPLYDGFVDLTKETPASPQPPAINGKPSLGGGPSFFYGFQWLFFALLFFGFWIYFASAEYRLKVENERGEDASRHLPPPRKPWRPGASKEDDVAADPRVTSPE